MSDLTITSGKAARADIVLQRGTTPRLRVRITSEDVRSGRLIPRPLPGDVIAWTVAWPGAAPVTKTSAPDGGLGLDPVSRVVTYPLTLAEQDALPADTVAPYAVQITNADGEVRRHLEGTITVPGKP